jgi:5-formyltetrahydrofolate cyclo-ligase
MDSPAMTKAELRKIYRAKRQLLSPGQVELASTQIAARFFETFDLSKIKVLHCFISISRFNEIDTRPIFQRIWAAFPHVKTVVPRVDHEHNELESLMYHSGVELVHSKWKIAEPSHNHRVDAAEIDVVLVPLLCFDLSGHRVGYGRGYYDRFLARCRPDCQKVGLSMFEPVESIDDAHDGDVRLDSCITPEGTYEF